MSNRSPGFGFSREARAKVESKYDLELEKEAMEWIENVINKKIYTAPGAAEVHKILKDGAILCELMNALKPGSIKKINSMNIAFKQMENISSFLSAASAYGLANTDIFQTVDLFEAQNMHQVIMSIHALGRKAQTKGYTGPTLGPKEAARNEREFTEEQLKGGNSVIGLQMGSNKGASQAGQNFGKTRSILD